MNDMGRIDPDIAPVGHSEQEIWDRVRSRPVVEATELRDPMSTDAGQPRVGARGLSDTALAARERAWSTLGTAADLPRRSRQRSEMPPVRINDETPVTQAVDLLRARLMQVLKKHGMTRIAITSPGPGCGTTYMACNIAARFARIESHKTILMDLNFRAPGVGRSFGVSSPADLFDGLLGRANLGDCVVRYRENLALGLSSRPAPAPGEALFDARTARMLDRIEDRLNPDLMIFDLPPMLAYDELTAILPEVDAVLLVADGERTSAAEIRECERMLEGNSTFLGVMLNKSAERKRRRWGYRRG